MKLILRYQGVNIPVPPLRALSRIARRLNGVLWRYWHWHYSIVWGTAKVYQVIHEMLAARVKHDTPIALMFGLPVEAVGELPWQHRLALETQRNKALAAETRHQIDMLIAALGQPNDKAVAWRRLLAEIDPNFEETLGYDPVTAGVEFGRWREIMRGINGD